MSDEAKAQLVRLAEWLDGEGFRRASIERGIVDLHWRQPGGNYLVAHGYGNTRDESIAAALKDYETRSGRR